MSKIKFSFLISFLVITLVSNAQKSGNININGIIKGVEMKEGKASIIPISIGLDCIDYKFDTVNAPIVDNRFHFSGFMPYPHGFEAVYLNSKKINFRTADFFLDEGNITMICTYDTVQPKHPEIDFSKTNFEYQNKFLPKFKSIQDMLYSYINKREENRKKYNGKVPDSIKQENLKLRSEYFNKRNVFLRNYIKQHPKSFIPLALIGQSVERMSDDIVEIEKTFSTLPSKMKNTVSGQKIKEAFGLKNLLFLSDSLKMLMFIDSENNKKAIETKNSKYTLVDFWFSACKPCIAQFPELTSIYQTYKAKGFEIIGINTDKNADEWKASISKYKILWKQLWDKENATSSKLSITSFPTNLLIDNNGKIIYRNIELNQLKKFLEKNL